MTKTLRPYQAEALQSLRTRLKESHHPLLVNASVGAGKSLIIAELLLIMERAGFRSLCLTLNSTLIQQNADTYKLQGGNPGIYCAGLNAKDFEHLVIFASPHSVCKDISNQGNVSRQPFQLIIVDEAHQISPHDNDTMFRRIIHHYGAMAQLEQYSFRVVGLTGTPYRGKGESIVGEHQFFKEQVCDISTSWLIENGYLVKPSFGIPQTESFDFSQLRVQNTGKFDQKQLAEIIDKNERLTGEIMRDVVRVVENGRAGAFIFASTRKHCLECAKSLPDGQWAIITGETPHGERTNILNMARNGAYRYLISVNCLQVGVDIPSFDVCAWLRPTESLVLYTQGIGRVLRLHPGKSSALVLDYSGNLDRHGDIDDPIINEALRPQEGQEDDYCIQCFSCNSMNKVTTRRCIGIVNNKRCDHYFEFKECPSCGIENDKVSRECRSCQAELIDPNAKLKRDAITYELEVIEAQYWANTGRVSAKYKCWEQKQGYRQQIYVLEHHITTSAKSANIFYAKFIRQHVDKASDWYMRIKDAKAMESMLNLEDFKTPVSLICKHTEHGYNIVKKVFQIVNKTS